MRGRPGTDPHQSDANRAPPPPMAVLTTPGSSVRPRRPGRVVVVGLRRSCRVRRGGQTRHPTASLSGRRARFRYDRADDADLHWSPSPGVGIVRATSARRASRPPPRPEPNRSRPHPFGAASALRRSRPSVDIPRARDRGTPGESEGGRAARPRECDEPDALLHDEAETEQIACGGGDLTRRAPSVPGSVRERVMVRNRGEPHLSVRGAPPRHRQGEADRRQPVGESHDLAFQLGTRNHTSFPNVSSLRSTW